MVLDTGKNYSDPSQAAEAHGVRFISLLKISTDAGITGWSDIETQPHVGKSIVDAPSGGQIGFESLRAALLGEDPLERERLWQKMYRYLAYYGRQGAGMQMISGADIALWDIAGKALGQPICKLLGACYRDRVKAYASTLFRPTPDAMKAAVAEYLKHGFRAIKFGWGVFGRDLDLDIALVRAAREEAGPDIDLMVDGGWYGIAYADPFRPRPLRDWIRLVKALEELNVFWLEDFLHPDNYAGYAAVSEHTTTLRLAAGEQLAGYEAFERLAIEGRVDTLQPDLSRCGGITVGKQIADLVARRQINCVPHAWLTDLLKAASLHLNAYLMDSLYLEYNVSSASLLNHLCEESIPMVDGTVPVPTGPGLGVTVNERIVEQYRVL
ncbi:mandelate racemase/muconate lactonizing enzyme family protein [Litorilinea aerophila]|nr:mandelate racemase/muconate lactonizing enzyme family protein [Litorilinea aerophila]MCC9074985.1 mandelate racemase/muconate lactonizing enzyme family protein [Litorilinea aerophila]